MAGKPPKSSTPCWWHPPHGAERKMWFRAVNEVQDAVGEKPIADPEDEGGHSAKALFRLNRVAQHELLHAQAAVDRRTGVVTLPCAQPAGRQVRVVHQYYDSRDDVTRLTYNSTRPGGDTDTTDAPLLSAYVELDSGWVHN